MRELLDHDLFGRDYCLDVGVRETVEELFVEVGGSFGGVSLVGWNISPRKTQALIMIQ